MYHVLCTLYLGRCTLYCIPCTLYLAPCTLYLVPCTLYLVPCTLYLVHCTLYLVPCTLYLVRCNFVSGIGFVLVILGQQWSNFVPCTKAALGAAFGPKRRRKKPRSYLETWPWQGSCMSGCVGKTFGFRVLSFLLLHVALQ